MATTAGRVYRVVVKKDSSGGWGWFPTDPAGKTIKGGGARGYASAYNARRGAKRACGAGVKIDTAR